MTRVSLAIPAGILILTLAVPSSGQNGGEGSDASALSPSVQTTSQAAASSQLAAPRHLSDDEMGALYMVRKEYRAAADVYKRLSDANPQDAVYLNRLGIALHQQTELSLALRYYQRALKADPRYADAQNNIGTIWYERKKYGKAIRAYHKAIELRADAGSFYMNLGYAYFGDKKYEESIASFRQALALDPQIFDSSSGRAGTLVQDRSLSNDRGFFYFLLAKTFAQSGNAERCAIYLRKAKDEGYKEMNAVKSDPSFAAVLKDPAIQEVLEQRPDTAQP
jgi:tetratricopeptide (TPR) repeat protein